ncbi:MAG: hypothetical protein E7022_02825 [Desulfovibrio desulfuricans]|nr:hypothetical protein [Desulfovibrio desulfuricans]
MMRLRCGAEGSVCAAVADSSAFFYRMQRRLAMLPLQLHDVAGPTEAWRQGNLPRLGHAARDALSPKISHGCLPCQHVFFTGFLMLWTLTAGAFFTKQQQCTILPRKRKIEKKDCCGAAHGCLPVFSSPVLCRHNRKGGNFLRAIPQDKPQFSGGEMIAWRYGCWSHENGNDIMGDGLRDRLGNNLLEFCDKNSEKNILEALKDIPEN